FRVDLAMGAPGRVAPHETPDGLVALFPRARVKLLEAQAEVVGEIEIAAAVAGRLDRLVMPLQEPLRVGEGAVLLDVGRGGEEEDLGLDVPWRHLARLDLRSRAPEFSGLRDLEIADHEPVELLQPLALE